MKKDKKVFNFNLPNELKDYLVARTNAKNTTITQYITDLIVKDKEAEMTVSYKTTYFIPPNLKEEFCIKFGTELKDGTLSDDKIGKFLHEKYQKEFNAKDDNKNK
jgi:hypothetical protein